MRKTTLLLTIVWLSFQSEAQKFQVTEMAKLPEAVTNNAVCEGIFNGKSFVYSFGGLDASKLWSGVHLHSFMCDVAADIWSNLSDLPDATGKIAAAA